MALSSIYAWTTRNQNKGGALSWDDMVLQKVVAMPNQIQNSSFEQNGFNGWGFWNISAKSTNNTSHSGDYSVKTGLNSGGSEGAMIQELTCFSQGQTIYASAWCKTKNYGGVAKLKLEFWNDQTLITVKDWSL